MRKIVYLILYVVLVLSVVSCAYGDKNRGYVPRPGDTIYNEKAALAIYDNYPERAMLIIDSAEIVGNLDKDHANFLRAMVYTKSIAGQQFDKAQRILEGLMETDYVEDLNNREAVIELLINVSRCHGDNEQWLRWASEKVELCRQQEEETEALRTEAEIGLVLAMLGEVDRGLAKINAVIGILDEQRHFNEMDACIIAIKRKINIVDLQERPADIIQLAQRIINKINDYRQHSDEYADGSFRMPQSPEQVEKYCDFYTAQAYGFMAKAYAGLDITNTARCYLDLFEESDYGKTYSGRKMVLTTWRMLGDFDKMLSICDEVTACLGSDTINIDYSEILYSRAVAADAAGKYGVANDYWRRYTSLQDLLNKNQRESRAYHYAVNYHLQDERMKTEKSQAKAHNSMLLAIAGFILFIVAVVFIVWLLVKRRAINRKNVMPTEQIPETTKYKKVIKKSKPQTPTSTKVDVASLSNEDLFKYLSEVIRSEELFLDPAFGRQVLVDRFNISERRIGAAFTITEGLPDFIRDLRLEYACRMMTDNPDMPLGDIATASGFSNLTVFGRDFKRKYEVTPTQYRSKIKAKK